MCGRDRLFGLLKRHAMLIHRTANLLEGQEITAPNQAWVSDLTYLRSEQGFCYLALITDVHSRRIMGADLSVSLSADGVLRGRSARREHRSHRV